MPRGQNPNSRKNLKKAYNGKGGFDTESARRAKAKSDESKLQKRRIAQDLMEQSTPETISEANRRLLQAVRHGNLKAYEIWVAMMGEKPQDKVQVTTQADDMEKMDEILRQMGMIDEQSDSVTEV